MSERYTGYVAVTSVPRVTNPGVELETSVLTPRSSRRLSYTIYPKKGSNHITLIYLMPKANEYYKH